ncbi:MAG: DUF1207 domain-containing protein [Planctomycetota bacterium]
MLRWWCCCGLVLGLAAIAWGDSTQVDPLFRQAETTTPGESKSPATFGLQVGVGFDDRTHSSNEFRAITVSQTGFFHLRASDPVQRPFEQFGVQQGNEDPPFVAVDGIDLDHDWRVLPVGLMYKSYLAGEKESRVQSVWLTDQHGDLVWETALGGRFSFLRHGTSDPVHPEGWQLDFEGAALPRVDPKADSSPLIAADFRIGLLSTWRFGPNAFKAGYYHLSSHLGDEFLIRNPRFVRLNYVRDSAIVGWTRDLTPEAQVYGEVAYALNHEDGALPWEFQYGIQYSPRVPGLYGAPFGGINGHTRQDFNYETSINVVAGWQWWGEQSNHTFRVGIQYYDGPALQYSFVNKHETLMGWGIWFDY